MQAVFKLRLHLPLDLMQKAAAADLAAAQEITDMAVTEETIPAAAMDLMAAAAELLDLILGMTQLMLLLYAAQGLLAKVVMVLSE